MTANYTGAPCDVTVQVITKFACRTASIWLLTLASVIKCCVIVKPLTYWTLFTDRLLNTTISLTDRLLNTTISLFDRVINTTIPLIDRVLNTTISTASSTLPSLSSTVSSTPPSRPRPQHYHLSHRPRPQHHHLDCVLNTAITTVSSTPPLFDCVLNTTISLIWICSVVMTTSWLLAPTDPPVHCRAAISTPLGPVQAHRSACPVGLQLGDSHVDRQR